MNIVILGGTGLVGGALNARLSQNHSVKTAGRSAFNSLNTLTKLIESADVIIQLSGANIGKRWSKAYKQELFDSRIKTTELLAQAIQQLDKKPRVFCASAVGIYPQSNDCSSPVDESCTSMGNDFLAQLGQAWETASLKIEPKPVIFRFGVVLSPSGGALKEMLPAFKFGMGGPIGSGQQCFSWVHINDLVDAFEWALENENAEGIYNLTSPNPLKQKDFAKALGKALNRPAFMPLPEFMLKLMFGEGAEVLTSSLAVKPTRLMDAGFKFQHPMIETALNDLMN